MTAPKSRASLSVLIALSVWSIWSLALAQGLRPVARQRFTKRLVAAAIERTHHSVRYVSDYVRIPYPNGDVPPDTGVCTDEIIRSYRAVGVDLQKEVHQDMVQNFSAKSVLRLSEVNSFLATMSSCILSPTSLALLIASSTACMRRIVAHSKSSDFSSRCATMAR
jgi:hypothetical protein